MMYYPNPSYLSRPNRYLAGSHHQYGYTHVGLHEGLHEHANMAGFGAAPTLAWWAQTGLRSSRYYKRKIVSLKADIKNLKRRRSRKKWNWQKRRFDRRILRKRKYIEKYRGFFKLALKREAEKRRRKAAKKGGMPLEEDFAFEEEMDWLEEGLTSDQAYEEGFDETGMQTFESGMGPIDMGGAGDMGKYLLWGALGIGGLFLVKTLMAKPRTNRRTIGKRRNSTRRRNRR